MSARLWVLGLTAIFVALSWSTHFSLSRAWPCALLAYFAAALLWGLVLRVQSKEQTFSLPLIVVGALLFRGAMLFSEPFFSDDIWRYMWDGHVQSQGINPYQHAPASEALAALRTPTWSKVNFPEVPTIYPPVAQMVFWLADKLGGGPLPLRLCIIAAEMSMIPALWRLVPKERRATVTLAVLWSPLMVVEFAGSSHLDTLAIAPLVWSVAWVAPGLKTRLAPLGWKPWLASGVCVGLSLGAKLLGLVALPALLIWAWWPAALGREHKTHRGPRVRRVVSLLAGLVICVGVTFTPYSTRVVFDETGSFVHGLVTYARKWRANDGAFAVMVAAEREILATSPLASKEGDKPHWKMDALVGLFSEMGITHQHEGQEVVSTTLTRSELELTLVKLLIALFLGGLLLFLLHQHVEPSTQVLVMLGALLLLAPTAHPWYIAWLVPLAAVHRAKPLLLWSALVPLAYVAAARFALEGVWDESVAVRLVEYVPVFVALAWFVPRRLTRSEDERA